MWYLFREDSGMPAEAGRDEVRYEAFTPAQSYARRPLSTASALFFLRPDRLDQPSSTSTGKDATGYSEHRLLSSTWQPRGSGRTSKRRSSPSCLLEQARDSNLVREVCESLA
jgi:hypothetical protein